MSSHETVIPLSSLRRPATLDGIPSDQLGRYMRDLRISITDRCNFRCAYCMPKDSFGRDHVFLSHNEILRYEEITRIARVFVGLGIRKIRLTGGEPLVRKGVESLIAQLAEIPDIELTLTTNGALLTRYASALKEAGLQRLTVSLDALDDDIFQEMNGVGFPVRDVLAGIDAAAAAGLTPVKVNMVVKRGVNDHQILPMARQFRGSGHILRFIEFMDVGNSNDWRTADVVSAREILDQIGTEFPLEPVDRAYNGEVAERWRYVDGAGEIGVIASVTQAFCSDCTRIRLSPEGKLFTCLFATRGHDLRSLLREGRSDEEMAAWISSVWQQRTDRYSEIRGRAKAGRPKIEMSYIGG
jgi:cyclic pyranopterin phosphate synthase